MEFVCRPGCHECGDGHHCVQLKTLVDVYYHDTLETLPLPLRAGCVCMPLNIGEPAGVFSL